jgi:hypothetical protein
VVSCISDGRVEKPETNCAPKKPFFRVCGYRGVDTVQSAAHFYYDRKKRQGEQVAQARTPDPVSAGKVHTFIQNKGECEEKRPRSTKKKSFFHV